MFVRSLLSHRNGRRVHWILLGPILHPEMLKVQLTAAPKLPRAPIELPLYEGPLNLVPQPAIPYGFAAWNRVELNPSVNKLLRERSYEVYMNYAGVDPDTDLYRFELSRPHQGLNTTGVPAVPQSQIRRG
jgi:hypothetical protein